MKGFVRKRRKQEGRKEKGQVRSVLKQVNVSLRGQGGLAEREKDGRPGGSVWIMVQQKSKGGGVMCG